MSASRPSSVRLSEQTSATPGNDPLTAEELILQMNAEELQELLYNLGFKPSLSMAEGIQRLVAELGSLDAAIVALHDDGVARRAA